MNRNLLIGLVSLVVLLVGVAVVKGGNRERPAVTTEELALRTIVERVSASGKINLKSK